MSDPFTFGLIVEADLHGIRIDSFLVKQFRNYTPWRMQRIVSAGHVHVDSVRADPLRRVFTGEQVQVRLVEPPDRMIRPECVPFRIVYEDPWLLVVDKPAGIIAHPTGESQSGTLANGLQRYLDSRTPLAGLLRPGIVHRLDRQTSGLMAVAIHHRSHAALSTAFESHRVSKTYIALVDGVIRRDVGTIDLPIGRATSGRGVLMSARGDAVKARPALTRYRVLKRLSSHTVVEAKPQTGRNHQIRVHFAQIGHPLVGDEFYAPRGVIRSSPPPAPYGWLRGRHALHAACLGFSHPITGVWLTFHASVPGDMQMVIAAAPPLSPTRNPGIGGEFLPLLIPSGGSSQRSTGMPESEFQTG